MNEKKCAFEICAKPAKGLNLFCFFHYDCLPGGLAQELNRTKPQKKNDFAKSAEYEDALARCVNYLNENH